MHRQQTFARAVDKRKSPAIYQRCTYSVSYVRPFFTRFTHGLRRPFGYSKTAAPFSGLPSFLY